MLHRDVEQGQESFALVVQKIFVLFIDIIYALIAQIFIPILIQDPFFHINLNLAELEVFEKNFEYS